MKNKYYIFVSLIGLLNFQSCDVLDVDPVSFITDKSFWTTEDDANGALIGVYTQFRDLASRDLYLLGEARSEMLCIGADGGSLGYDIYYNNTLNQDNIDITWQQFYSVINSCNLILKKVPAIDFKNGADKNLILAQAYSMRAFCYFAMTKTWGDLIIHEDAIEGALPEQLFKERSSQSAVFDLIKNDIKSALDLYPNTTVDNSRSMWSKPATLVLKADVYLWTGKLLGGGQQDFRTALDALEEINKNDFMLIEYKDIFDYGNKGNQEIVFSVRFDEIESGINFYRLMWMNANAVPGDVSDEIRNKIFPIGEGQGIIVGSQIIRDQFITEDTRRDATFLEIYSKDTETGQPKYYSNIILKGQGLTKDGYRHFCSDVIIYRYADILLLTAEAKNALNMDPTSEINEIRKRAYKDKYKQHIFTKGTQAENDKAILKERLLEFAFEGKRWWDLIRFDAAFELVPSLNSFNGNKAKLLFPISMKTLSLEPKVVQNEGWKN